MDKKNNIFLRLNISLFYQNNMISRHRKREKKTKVSKFSQLGDCT